MKKMKLKGFEDVVLPAGFRAGGLYAAIKRAEKKDLGVVISDRPAAVAGTFTTNQVKAATVRLDMERVKGGVARAVVVNSGNANACNGARGMRDATRMAALTAEVFGLPEKQVLVCSTGTIGLPLPMDKIEAGICSLPPTVREQGGNLFMEAILTTDTRPKRWTVPLKIGGRKVTVTGVCKGAGMIEPNMATMLAFLFTDAAIGAPLLRKTLKEAVDRSFNRITVDGDRSTNDTCLIFANGAAGNAPLKAGTADYERFRNAVFEISHQLALMIAKDGEGATKFMTINVRGARTDKDADLAARAVANSFLVKTAWAGPGANWGRVMDALGYSPAKVVEGKVSIKFDGLQAVRNGVAGKATREQLMDVIARKEFAVDIDLGLGRGQATVYTCNITEEYVRVNM